MGDIRLPGMLHASFVRCPYGHARIASLSLDRARAMPGVRAVFSARDLPELHQSMPASFEQPDLAIRMPTPLAMDEIRYAGEAIAVVLADDLYSAADGAEAVEVEYELLDVVVDPGSGAGGGERARASRCSREYRGANPAWIWGYRRCSLRWSAGRAA